MSPCWILVILPLFLFAVIRLATPGGRYDLDFDQVHATFFAMLDRYTVIAKSIAILAIATAVYGRYVGVSEFVIATAIAGAADAVYFIVWITSCYETYLHARYPKNQIGGTSSYTASAYAATRALGYSSIIFTLYALAATLFWEK